MPVARNALRVTNPEGFAILAMGWSGGTLKPWVADENGLWVSDYPESASITGISGLTYLKSPLTLAISNISGREIYLVDVASGGVITVDMEFTSAIGGVTYGNWASSYHIIRANRASGFFQHIGLAIDTSGGNTRYAFIRQVDPDGTVTILDETSTGINLGALQPYGFSDNEVYFDFTSPDRFSYNLDTYVLTNLATAAPASASGGNRTMCYTTGAGDNAYMGEYLFGFNQLVQMPPAFPTDLLFAFPNDMINLSTGRNQDTTPDGSILTQFASAYNFTTSGLFATKPGALTEAVAGFYPNTYADITQIIVPEAPGGSIHSTEPPIYGFRTS